MSEKYISKDNLKLAIDGIKLGTMADWNENDKNAPGYIKNRPFYTENREVMLVDNLTSTTEEDWPVCTFVVGDSYKVIWNDVEYDCVCYEDDGWRVLGSTEGEHLFYIDDNGGDALYVEPMNGDESWTVSIIHMQQELKQLDPVYIPDIIARTEDLEAHTTSETAHSDIREAVAENSEQMLVWHDFAVAMPVYLNWRYVTYGVDKFVAVAYNTLNAAYSADGITWTSTTMPSSSRWNSIVYGSDKFVAIAYNSNKAAYSADGITWTAATLPSTKNWTSVTYGNGVYVAVAYNTNVAAYSTDGITWTSTTMPSSGYWNSVTYGNGKFVSIRSSSTVAAYSEDGVNWTETTVPTSGYWNTVYYGNGKFISLANNSDVAVYSTDGINWTAMTLPSAQSWYSVIYGNDKFVATSHGSVSIYSEDGINWTKTTMPSSGQWQALSYGDGKFVTIRYNSTSVAYSYDGIEWFSEFREITQNDELVTDAITEVIFEDAAGYINPFISTHNTDEAAHSDIRDAINAARDYIVLNDMVTRAPYKIQIKDGNLVSSLAAYADDFTYTTNDDGTRTITGWNETYFGVSSTEMVVPDDGTVII